MAFMILKSVVFETDFVDPSHSAKLTLSRCHAPNPKKCPAGIAFRYVSIVDGGLGSSEGALYFKEGGGNITYTNIYVDGLGLGVKVKSADVSAKARIAAGNLVINPIQFANNKQNFVLGQEGSEAAITEGDNLGAGNGAELPVWAEGWAE